MNDYTCCKIYKNIPFAHRQHKHTGHCKLIHGHNWDFKFYFSSQKLDDCNFVVDFGKLKFIKEWIELYFDHALILNKDDPKLSQFQDCAKILLLDSCSCEGIANYIYNEISTLLKQEYENVKLVCVEVWENENNYASFKP